MLGTSLGSFLVALGLVWGASRILHKSQPIWLRAFGVLGAVDRCFSVKLLSYLTGTQWSARPRWTQFSIVTLMIVLATAFAPAPVAAVALYLGFLMIWGIMRHWSQDEREREQRIPTGLKLIKRDVELRNEVAVAAALVFLLSPLGFSRLDAAYHIFPNPQGSALLTIIFSAFRYVGFTWFEAPHSVPIVHAWAGTYFDRNPFSADDSAPIKYSVFLLRLIFELLVVSAFIDLMRISKRVAALEDLRGLEEIYHKGSDIEQENAVESLAELMRKGRVDAAELLAKFLLPTQYADVVKARPITIRLAAAKELNTASEQFGWRTYYFAVIDSMKQIITMGSKWPDPRAANPPASTPWANSLNRPVNVPGAMGDAHRALGDALRGLGERDGGRAAAARLNEAVGAYGEAIKFFARDNLPKEWAITQYHLGNAFWVLSQQASGEAANDSLLKALEAYNKASEVFNPSVSAQWWALTKGKLGRVYFELALAEDEEVRDDQLRRSIDAYTSALEIFGQGKTPGEWASTQRGLGDALQELGKREPGVAGNAILVRAVDAYTSALEIFGQGNAYSDAWASTQCSIGDTLLALGKREPGPAGKARLVKAVEAYQKALKVDGDADRGFDADEVQCSMQIKLGDTYVALAAGECDKIGMDWLKLAVAIYSNARVDYGQYVPRAMYMALIAKLCTALRALGECEKGEAGNALLELADQLEWEVKEFELSVEDNTRVASPTERIDAPIN